MIKKILLSSALLVATMSVATAQSLPNYGPNAPANGDSYGKPYSGAKPLRSRASRSYAYVHGHHHHRHHTQTYRTVK